ncbi:CPBP family intramembrane glutamic endopeptidase [Nocardia sp. NPDC059177]|uniref:CPBP family intramembrane glutamic endopeptidase n=1 Tax=Nocardia sp. NPDC059177 TaxID=3346759 RepID=UPI00367AD9DF
MAIGVFVVSTLVGSMFLLAVQPYSGIDPAVLSLVQFGPALGAAVTWLVVRRTVTAALPAAVSVRRVGWVAVAIIVVCVAFGALIIGAAVVAGVAPVGPVAVEGVSFGVFVLLQLLGAGGEEIGWRGVMQPVLESRTTRFVAVAITGATWTLWHVQAFTLGPVVAICFIVSTMSFAIVLGDLSVGSFRQRVLIAAIGHWLINIACYLLAGDNTFDQPQVVFIAVAAVFIAVAAVLVAATVPGARRWVQQARKGTVVARATGS